MTETEFSSQAHVGLFDIHGRRIPSALSAAAEAEIRRYFVCDPPPLDLGRIHARIRAHLAPESILGVEEFAARIAKIRARLETATPVANILRGACAPFFLPKLPAHDIGAELDERFLPALDAAYRGENPGYEFVRHHKDSLVGKLSVAGGSRHERLIEAMRESNVVGCYFPCLPGFSLPAAIEQMAALPEMLLLAGGFDTCAALIGSPTLLLRQEGYPPLLWFAALLGEKEGIGYHLEAYGRDLTFNRRAHIGQAAEYWSSGIVLLG